MSQHMWHMMKGFDQECQDAVVKYLSVSTVSVTNKAYAYAAKGYSLGLGERPPSDDSSSHHATMPHSSGNAKAQSEQLDGQPDANQGSLPEV